MRQRNKVITVRMNAEEHAFLQQNLKQTGQTQQSFMINAMKGVTIATVEDTRALKEVNRTLGELVKQVRGVATNINQMAYIANRTGNLPSSMEMQVIGTEIGEIKKECDWHWQLIRQLISQQRVMEQ
ncbi:MAG: plasmid mobilization relaxosome protein MobC [Eubacteriales bacterium]